MSTSSAGAGEALNRIVDDGEESEDTRFEATIVTVTDGPIVQLGREALAAAEAARAHRGTDVGE